ncbi:uncharacterized protein B0H18DRAFT_1070655 [Fomitopsis serialis]|uniref:uncharacterized protein n=1 Tax=Fomitopsis serialis TaxID=139415 RepID=UPI002008627B|nr:uncharacterized protein B0H18DRAFT_1070655 [Neoantrodia serialis]KAH9910365.1 hypothetical protein B0H18DRAFT_1070655 [Neoantrodia serialis]
MEIKRPVTGTRQTLKRRLTTKVSETIRQARQQARCALHSSNNFFTVASQGVLGVIIGVGFHWTYIEFDKATIGASDSSGSDATFMRQYGTSKPVIMSWIGCCFSFPIRRRQHNS